MANVSNPQNRLDFNVPYGPCQGYRLFLLNELLKKKIKAHPERWYLKNEVFIDTEVVKTINEPDWLVKDEREGIPDRYILIRKLGNKYNGRNGETPFYLRVIVQKHGNQKLEIATIFNSDNNKVIKQCTIIKKL